MGTRKTKGTGRPSFRPKTNNGRFVKRVKTVDKKLYGEDWEQLSQYVRQRDGYRCRAEAIGMPRCGNVFPPPFHGLLHAHHIVPLPRGTNHPKNLISLCRTCHGKHHGKNLGKITEKQIFAAKRLK